MGNTSIVILAILALSGTLGGYYFGNNQGYSSGYDTGLTLGYSTGYESGYKSGYSNGTVTGYNKGYSTGYEKGETIGYSRGNTTGYNQGYSTGFNIGYDEGNSTGYSSGYLEGFSDTGFTLRYPTYTEAMTFIASDRTNYNTYIDGSYVCHDFSYDLKRNAFDAGYHCLYVAIEMGDYIVQQGHALIAFNTTDRGLIYIEPQSDQIMDVKVGQHYWDRAIYEKPDYDDTITKIEFIP